MFYISIEDRLAESQAANSALMAQLDAQNPQYVAMEQTLFDTKQKLEAETKRSRDRELAQEELEERNREIQYSLEQSQIKCHTLQEKLSMKEDEVDEVKIEVEVLKEKHHIELEQLRLRLAESSKLSCVTSNPVSEDVTVPKSAKNEVPFSPMSAVSRATIDSCDAVVGDTEKDDYVRRLEDELEDITEQLIKAEAAVSELEAKAASADSRNVSLEGMISDLKEQVNSLEKSNEANLRDGQRALSAETAVLQEKIDDLSTKLSITEDELLNSRIELTKSLEHIQLMKGQIKDSSKFASEDRASKIQISTLGNALEDATSHIAELRDEVENLMFALNNSKADHAKALDEIDALKSAYDELNAEGKRLLKDKEEEWALKYETDFVANNPLSPDYESEQLRKQLIHTRNELVSVKRKLAEFESAEMYAPAMQTMAISPRNKKSLINISSIQAIALGDEDMGHGSMSKRPRMSTNRSQSRSRQRTPHSSYAYARSRSCSPTVIERLERALMTATSQVNQLREECDSLGRQKRFSEVRVKHLEDDMSRMHQQLQSAEITEQNESKPNLPSFVDVRDNDEGSSYIQTVLRLDDINVIKTEFQALSRKMLLQRDQNGQLLSRVLQLQGNIQVCCRVRPMKAAELKGGQNRLVEPLSETEVGCFDSRTKTWRSFVFDNVWGPESSQQGVFQDVEPLALSVVEGYNACIFAYGQT